MGLDLDELGLAAAERKASNEEIGNHARPVWLPA